MNMRYSTKIVLLSTVVLINILRINTASLPVDDKSANNDGKAAAQSPRCAAAAAAAACFSSDTLVTLANQQQIPIGQLRSGHQLLTTDGITVVNTEMMLMLDQNHRSSAMFHTILTASGHKLSLTALHLITTLTKNDQLKYKAARDVREGDILRVVTNGTVHPSVVTNVTMEVKRGYYAPLTMAGTLLVNGVAASCFANIENHELAQLSLSPLRWYYGVSRWLSVESPFGGEQGEGMHQIPLMLYKFVQSINPSILRLS